MAVGAHKITALFEEELCKYTGAPIAIATDNMSNALWICLMYFRNGTFKCDAIDVPSHTYPSVPAEVKLAGYKVNFVESNPMLKGEYRLDPLPVWDSALRFTADMYRKEQFQCISFSGPHKHLKLGKGGAILLDDEKAYEWMKRARNSGRGECSYHEDKFTQLGRNCYILPEIAAKGLHLMPQFYNPNGTKKHNEDICLEYPDLNDPKHTAFR